MLVKPVSLVPRNPADSWGIAESDDTEAETKSETARHAAPVRKAAADNLADRCRLRNQTSEIAWHAVPAHSAAADSLADRCRLHNQTPRNCPARCASSRFKKKCFGMLQKLAQFPSFQMSSASKDLSESGGADAWGAPTGLGRHFAVQMSCAR